MSMNTDFRKGSFSGETTFIILPKLNKLDRQLMDRLNKQLGQLEDLDLKVHIVTKDIYNSDKMQDYFKQRRVAQVISISDSELLGGKRTSKIELRKFPGEEKMKAAQSSKKEEAEVKGPKEGQEKEEVKGPKEEKRKTGVREERNVQTQDEATPRKRIRLPEQYVQHFEQYGIANGINFTDKANPSLTQNVQKDEMEGLDEASYEKLAEQVQLVFEQVNPIEEETKKEGQEEESKGFAKESGRTDFNQAAKQQKTAPRPRQGREAAESLIQQSRADEKHRRDHAAKVREEDKKRERDDIKSDELKREIKKEEVNKTEKRAKNKS